MNKRIIQALLLEKFTIWFKHLDPQTPKLYPWVEPSFKDFFTTEIMINYLQTFCVKFSLVSYTINLFPNYFNFEK